MRVRFVAVGATLVVALSGCGVVTGPDGANVRSSGTTAAPSTVVDAALPAGWRWESFGHLVIGVPASWAYGTTDTAWCAQRAGAGPYVGRPGAVAAVGCSGSPDKDVDPGTLLKPGGTFVWFAYPDEVRTGDSRQGSTADPVHSGDRDTFVAADVQVAIQAPAELRQQIRSTLQIVNQDHNGCAVDSPFVQDPAWRPHGPAVTSLTDVQDVSACNYAGGHLISSVHIDGPPAAEAIAAAAAAPVGGGPNSPAGSCLPDTPATEEAIILQIVSAHGPSRIVLHYGGCFDNGLDDGASVRTLTRPAVAPFVSGPNRVTGFNVEGLVDILTD